MTTPRRCADLQPPKARYQQVADILRTAINAGEYGPGDPLPSQPELARQYGLNQTSISRAITVLRHEGLVRVEQGRGAYVQERPVVRRVRRIPHSSTGSSFAAEMRRIGLDPKTDLVDMRVVTASPEIAERLRLGSDDAVLMRQRHMYASGRPVQLATSYIPLAIAGDPQRFDPDANPAVIYERLAEQGNRASHISEEIEVRRPTPEEATFLELADGQPVLVVTRLTLNQHQKPMDVAVNVMGGFEWRLLYEWDAADDPHADSSTAEEGERL
jgi:GntR family transcriptional regulator